MYKARLLKNVIDDAKNVRKNIKALFHTQAFISSATYEAALGDSYSFFGRIREAGELISVDFAERDSVLKSPDDRVLPFLRAQLFIALVANLEVFLAEILREILLSYPGKIQTEKIESRQVVEAVRVMDLTEKLVLKNITSIFYDSPQGYRDKVEQILSAEKDLLDPFWEDLTEMKATRDLGLHTGWIINSLYLTKAGSKARNINIGEHLNIEREYFDQCIRLAECMVDSIERHLRIKYANCTKANVFKEMWDKSSLSERVPFEQAWRIIDSEMIAPVEDFKFRWSSTEEVIFKFFKSIYSSSDLPPFPKILYRLNKNDQLIINQWLNSPFYF